MKAKMRDEDARLQRGLKDGLARLEVDRDVVDEDGRL
jgi:hypothetical protein